MEGIISSAQTRVYKTEEPKTEVKPTGSISSHDVLRSQPQTEQPQSIETKEVQQTEQVVVPVENVVPEPIVEQKKPDSPNFRQVRQKAEQLERENREKEEIIQRLLRAQQQPQHVQQQEQTYTVGDDEIIEGKHYKQLGNKLSKVEQEFNAYKQQTAVELSKARLRSNLSDYDQVMTQDNIKDLEYAKPALARALAQSGDFEGAAEAAYYAIKSLGINKQTASEDAEVVDYESQKKRAQANLAKPKPINAIAKSNSPLSQTAVFSSELTQARKDEIWARMKQKLRTKRG